VRAHQWGGLTLAASAVSVLANSVHHFRFSSSACQFYVNLAIKSDFHALMCDARKQAHYTKANTRMAVDDLRK
jgi:hypothetical protein